jgi:hypothetical protein
MRHRSLWSAATSVVAAALVLALAAVAPAEAADDEGFALDDFQVETAQNLLDICTLDRSHPNYWEAKAFCYGYFQGGADFHQALASGPNFQPIVCPTDDVTVRDAVDAFVAYARAHPESLSERPMDVVFRAVSEKWPCS